MKTNQNDTPPDSVELRVLSTLRSELQVVEAHLRNASYDDCQFFENVRDYMAARIQSISSRIR